jgi:hypothetical protein
LVQIKTANNRKKVTIEWNKEGVLKVTASSFEHGVPNN